MHQRHRSAYSRSGSKLDFLRTISHYRDLAIRKWWVLLVGLLIGAALEVALVRYQRPSYVSAGQMIVNVKLSVPQGPVLTEELSNFLGTQAALMQSDIVVNRALPRVPAPVGTNTAVLAIPALKVSVSPRTTIFNLQARGLDPDLTQTFLQASMEEYIRLKREMRKQASDSTVADLSEEVLTLEKELRRSEQALAEFQGTNSMVWLEEQGNNVANYLASLNQRLDAFRSERDLLQTLTLDQNLQRQDLGSVATPAQPQPQSTESGSGTNTVVNNNALALDYLKARQQLLLLKGEQQDLGQFLRPKHPKMIAMSEDIARRERLLEIYRQQNAEQLEARKASIVLQVQTLEKDLRDWNARIVEISRKSAEYQRLKANTHRIQNLYQQMLATVQTLDSNKEIGAETVSIMQPACPAFLDTRQARNNLIFAAIGAALGTIALLLLLDRLDDRVSSFSELQELFHEPVLGQIPRQKRAGGSKQIDLLQPDDSRHGFAEAYRNLRSSLLFLPGADVGDERNGEATAGKRPKLVLITSSIPSEGKSVTIANLAITLANAGARVLIVDADLRKGVLHHRLAIKADTGLSEVLADGTSWQKLVQKTKYQNVSLLPRGSISNESGDLFLGPVTPVFFKEAAAAYDFVLVDTAPIMAADDVTTLAPMMDAVLFVLRAEHTSARVAHAALQMLYQRRVRILGIIFNAVRPGSGEYYYYYKYHDYYTSAPVKRLNSVATIPS